jgi:hypothetical protein
LYDKKDKTKQTQPTQDNTTSGVNKPMENETVVCWLCHKEGHKSYQCKVKTEGDKKEKANKQDLHHLHQQGGQKSGYILFDQEEKEWKGDSHQGQQASQQGKGDQTKLSAKGDYFNR